MDSTVASLKPVSVSWDLESLRMQEKSSGFMEAFLLFLEKLNEAWNHYKMTTDHLQLILKIADRSHFNKNKVAPPSWNILFRDTVVVISY